MVGTSRGTVATIYGFLLLGVSAVSVALLPGVRVLRTAGVVELVTGGRVFDWTTLVVSGGLVLLGLAAILFGTVLIGAQQHR